MNGQTNYHFETYADHKSQLNDFQTSDGKMAYLDLGKSKKVLLLVHGVPTSSWLYRKMVNPLVDAGFRVIVPDMLGFGASEKPDDPDLYLVGEHSKRILELMNHLGIKSWHHLVHDAGGPWSWKLISENSHRIESLVLLNTILYKEGFKPPIKLKSGSWFSNLIIAFYGSKFTSKMIIGSTLRAGTKSHKFSKIEKAAYVHPMLEGGNIAVGAFFTGFIDMFEILLVVQGKLAENEFPMFIIWGKKDKILQGHKQIPLIQKELRVPDSNVFHLTAGAHFIQEDLPEVIVEKLVQSLK